MLLVADDNIKGDFIRNSKLQRALKGLQYRKQERQLK